VISGKGVVLLVALLVARPGLATCLIAIDVGHDAVDVGTLSARGQPEWRFNLALGQMVYAALRRAGLDAMLLAADGRPLPLADRPRLAELAGAALFVSLHHDSAQDQYLSRWRDAAGEHDYSDLFSGYGLFVSRRNPAYAQSIEVARAIGKSLRAAGLHPSLHHAEAIAGENRPLLDAEFGLYRFDDLAVLRRATMPALLLEAGVLINRDEELTVATDAYRQIIAAAVTSAARDYCIRRALR
jgi:N-acetylmuramoyl-L-alanine amidase